MERKAYAEPKILRVKLKADQAVLSQCSEASGSLSDSNPLFCTRRCRQRRGRRGSDFEGSS